MKEVKAFQNTVWQFYHTHGRDLPWRHTDADGKYDPYKILVSEIMLQQTQAVRVIPKYEEFLVAFPTIASLASAPLGRVLTVWSGLGYNRRARYLQQAARSIVEECNEEFPQTRSALTTLPGVGINTAAAVMVYAYDTPAVFIETNIRTVYIYHFFRAAPDKVSDKQIIALVEQTLPSAKYREWYWALMDYGTHLKKTEGGFLSQSKTYKKQSQFQGSARQIRGQVIRLLTTGSKTDTEISAVIPDERLPVVLLSLIKEKLIIKTNSHYHLS